MAQKRPRLQFDLKFLLALPLCFVFWVLLVAATTSRAVLSPEVQLPDGTRLIAQDIKRNHLPFTTTWLRRDLELIETRAGTQEKVVHKLSSFNLPPEGKLLSPRIKLLPSNQVVVELYRDQVKMMAFQFQVEQPADQ